MARTKPQIIQLNAYGYKHILRKGWYLRVSFSNENILYRVNDDDANRRGYIGTFKNKGNHIDIPENVNEYLAWETSDIFLKTVEDETITVEIYEWKPGADE